MTTIDLQSFIRPASDFQVGKGTFVTFFGDAGVGKTTAAARCFPSPIFLPIEPGLRSVLDVDAFSPPTTSGQVIWYLNQIKESVSLGSFRHKTIVLDSVSELDTMISRELCKSDHVDNIYDYKKGFGKGQSAVGNVQTEVKEICKDIVSLGINVVAISHAKIELIDPPDGDSYTRWVLQMVRSSTFQWVNQVDAVIHVRESLSTMREKGKPGKAKSVMNQRVFDMVAKPASVSKNRMGIQSEVLFTFDPEKGEFNNPLAPIFNF